MFEVSLLWFVVAVETWGEKQAEKYLQDMEDKLNQLVANPELGRQRPEIFEMTLQTSEMLICNLK